MSTSVPFIKGHGTENDFILLPSYDDELSAGFVEAICDRRSGIGADGVLRVDRDGDHFFMDYRNADGSIAETCGNGIRVFARYLVDAGLALAGDLVVGTRSGNHAVTVPGDGGDITVNMGQAERLVDAAVSIGTASWKAAGWSMGNPHLVVVDAAPIDVLDLTVAPTVDPASSYAAGVNIELLEPVGPQHVRMRVYERGVGETRSCGTGACAAAVAAMDAAGERTSYLVDVPGGRLVIEWRADGTVFMTGPAVLVASGTYEDSAER